MLTIAKQIAYVLVVATGPFPTEAHCKAVWAEVHLPGKHQKFECLRVKVPSPAPTHAPKPVPKRKRP